MKIGDFKPGMKFYLPGKFCECSSVDVKNKQVHFNVINGQWEGRLDLDKNQIYIKFTKKYVQNQTPTLEGECFGYR